MITMQILTKARYGFVVGWFLSIRKMLSQGNFTPFRETLPQESRKS